MQALKTEKIKVLTVNPAQTSTPMTWSRPDAEYLPEKMIQPDEIAEAIMMTFKLGPNVFIEVCQICLVGLTTVQWLWTLLGSLLSTAMPALPLDTKCHRNIVLQAHARPGPNS